jgi:predicted membrane protein
VLTVLVTSLIATGVGIIISTLVNRTWIGLPLVALLSIMTAGLLVTQPDLDGGIGDHSITPRSVQVAERPQQLGIGELTVDLTQTPLGAEPMDVRAEVGLGHLVVVVPRDATVVIDAEIGAGDVVVDGDVIADGVRRQAEQKVIESVGVSSGTINLDVQVGSGRIDIHRAP